MKKRIPEAVQAWLEREGFGDVIEARPVGGGCIHNGQRLLTRDGKSVFLKSGQNVPRDMFLREAEGLQALAAPGVIRVPEVFIVGERFILMEDLAPADRGNNYWEEFGHRLAQLHTTVGESFGFDQDNYLGSTVQPNPRENDGFKFFSEHRLMFQGELARKRGLISRSDLTQIARLADKLPAFIPQQPASLIHGDLWSGNMISDSEGKPAIIDPAAHFGWREAELAMTALFGRPPGRFFDAYREVIPLPENLESRFPIYNLYHLLNHVNIFGKGYYPQVASIIKRYS